MHAVGRLIAIAMTVAILCIPFAHPARAQLVIGGEDISHAQTVDAARKEGRLLAYGTYPADAMKPILAAFQQDTGIAVEYVRLPTQSMYQRITSEFAAKKLEADYVDLTDLPLIGQLMERGILAV